MAGGFWRFYEKANSVVRFFTGPAQVGAGYDEGPEVRPADPACPICTQAMSLHRIERHTDDRPTRLHCPTPVATDAA
ncbi:hypothetical protein [Agromyces atrinae]|uniref:Uncharacterized protein n=1 Tax=Agromyces atrinae TaxID=592376 RepID=A0A4Q2M2N8_9MICO|nr:hypothetical protein [Agromyces atrinae]NYD68682.1 hypothetical protein [Agromyces atrinae]RXZ86049.1 hypothetical protein ESP50_12665 [Agromyces atrinae]